MADSKINVEVDVNLKLIHDEFAHAANLIADKYGVMIQCVDFEWVRSVGEKPQVHLVKLQTHYCR